MYKLLLCLRYLRTRWIALASIVSVTLGVATMIVVNSVMAGFTREMQVRIKGILSDVSFEATSLNGFRDPAEHMRLIRSIASKYIAEMSATVHVPAMLSFQVPNGETINKPVQLIGGDPRMMGRVGSFNQYLQHPTHRRGEFAFQLQDGGYDVRDHQAGDDSPIRMGMEAAGWELRREIARRRAEIEAWKKLQEDRKRRAQGFNNAISPAPLKEPQPNKVQLKTKLSPGLSAQQRGEMQAALQEILRESGQGAAKVVIQPDGSIEVRAAPKDEPNWGEVDEFSKGGRAPVMRGQVFDPAKQQHTGCVLGIALSTFRPKNGKNEEFFLVRPGEDVQITFPTAGTPPKAVSDTFTVVDLYASKMSEYDSQFVFVPIEKLQELRGMFDPTSGKVYTTSIQIKLKDERHGEKVRDLLRARFAPGMYNIQTWRGKQGPLLAAVQMETMILNVLLFLIIAVAGFGILAIFFMIVVEKTKDIGILKSLGAGSGGVAGIFLAYGLSLGLVGSGAGLMLGLLFVRYINEIADGLGRITGQDVFDPEIYYFYEIPTAVHPFTVAWIVCGALLIAVLASVLPACRAARFHPVEALRYE